MTLYFDYNATTPLDPRVLERMLPTYAATYANASSLHRSGQSGIYRAQFPAQPKFANQFAIGQRRSG